MPRFWSQTDSGDESIHHPRLQNTPKCWKHRSSRFFWRYHNHRQDLARATTLVIIARPIFHCRNADKPCQIHDYQCRRWTACAKNITLLDNLVIPPVKGNNCIKYLEVNFDGKRFLSQLEKDFRNLVTSLLLLET